MRLSLFLYWTIRPDSHNSGPVQSIKLIRLYLGHCGSKAMVALPYFVLGEIRLDQFEFREMLRLSISTYCSRNQQVIQNATEFNSLSAYQSNKPIPPLPPIVTSDCIACMDISWYYDAKFMIKIQFLYQCLCCADHWNMFWCHRTETGQLTWITY